MFCLTGTDTANFLSKLRSGEITPDKLTAMSSQERRAFFSSFLSEANAREVNALFESKLLLKNQQKGMINWAKKVSGLSPRASRDIINTVNRMTEALNPATEQAFLEDLVAHKLGATVTMEEASNIAELSKTVSETRLKMESSPRRTFDGPPTEAERAYGRARVAFDNYLTALKEEGTPIGEKLVEYLKNPLTLLRDVANTSKALVSTLDNSFMGRQGYKVMWRPATNKVWRKTFNKSFEIIYKTFKGAPVMDEIRAEILSDPMYELIKRSKVATASIEEAFPTSWPSRIPIIGKLFEASENAFTGSAYYMRYKTAKVFFDIAERTGVDLTDTNELLGIGKMVNSLTARGDTGVVSGKPGLINAIFWSPKKIKGDIDFLILHPLIPGQVSSFGQKQAALNLLSYVVGMAAVAASAKAIFPEGVELDPRSSDFGQIRVGNRRWDYTGGVRGLVTLASRLLTRSSKSTTTGKATSLVSGKYGSLDAMDVVYNFLENKTSPAASALISILRGEDQFTKEEPNIGNVSKKLFVPLSVNNLLQQGDETVVTYILGVLSDIFGVSSNIYQNKKKSKNLLPK